MDWMLPGCQEHRRLGRKLFILMRYHGTQTTATQDHPTLHTLRHVNTVALLLCLLSCHSKNAAIHSDGAVEGLRENGTQITLCLQ